jgi:anti-anti-sigma factor
MTQHNEVSLTLKTENRGDETWISVDGHDVSFDEPLTMEIEDRLWQLVERTGRCRLVLDLGNVTYLTSTTLGAFLRLHKKLHTVGGVLVLHNVLPHIYEIFSLTKLTRVLDVRMAEAGNCMA